MAGSLLRVPVMNSKLERFHDLVKDIEVAMMTTQRGDGLLVSRPMATQVFAEGADLWFVTTKGSPKLSEIAQSSGINLSYYKDRTREWISVSGDAREPGPPVGTVELVNLRAILHDAARVPNSPTRRPLRAISNANVDPKHRLVGGSCLFARQPNRSTRSMQKKTKSQNRRQTIELGR